MTAALVAVRPIRHVAIVSALPKVARRVMGGPALHVGGVSMLGGVVDRFYDARCWFCARGWLDDSTRPLVCRTAALGRSVAVCNDL